MTVENSTVNNFTGRVIIVTGASSGVGLAAASAFARGGARIALVARASARLDQALATVRAVASTGPDAVEAFDADFSRLWEVRALAARLREAYPRIDVLASNAGGSHRQAVTTADGFDPTTQINHLAPFLLSRLLIDRLAGGRVISTSSMAHQAGRIDPARFPAMSRRPRLSVYAAAKLAHLLFIGEAARRWPDISWYAFHPGLVRSRFGNDSFVMRNFYRLWPIMRTPAQGADTLVWLAGTPTAELTNGGYYVDRRLTEPARSARDADLAARLWLASDQAIGLGDVVADPEVAG